MPNQKPVSLYQLTLIVTSIIIFVIQLATTHEMRSFLKNQVKLGCRIYQLVKSDVMDQLEPKK